MLPMIYGLRDHERYVYHYTSLATARDYILKNRTLRLGTFARTNDPRESKDWTFNLSSRTGIDLGQYDFEKTSKWAAAGFVDTDLSFLSVLELYGTDVPERRMTARRVVEALDVVEHV